MGYHFSKNVPYGFDEAVEKVTVELKNEGFGILTEIDVKETLKKKLDVDIQRYKILGACNPNFAYKAIQAENKIGVFLPCNVVIQQHDDGGVEVSAVDPIASMSSVENEALGGVATEVQQKLKKVIAAL